MTRIPGTPTSTFTGFNAGKKAFSKPKATEKISCFIGLVLTLTPSAQLLSSELKFKSLD